MTDLASRFQQVARACPEAIAVMDGERRVDYRSLDQQVDRLARRLRGEGVTGGHLVGVHLDRSLEWVATILAILRAGAAYVPLARDHPAERLRFMIRDLQVRTVITGEPLPPEIVSATDRVLEWDTLLETTSGDDVHPPFPGNAPNDPAYVMFTSGSTGQPKGVVVPHRAILRLILDSDFLPWGPSLRFLLLAPTAFDASTLELWGPLLHGGSLVVHRENVVTLERIETHIREAGVNTLWLTAGLFHQFIDQRPEALRGLRFLLSGGDALSVPHVLRALAALPDTQLINGYGPTEGTTFTTTYAIPRDGSLARRDNVPIGRPLSGTACYILDSNRHPVPDGTPGELHIGGKGVALGYWKRPEPTAAVFLPDPFSLEPGATMYRSGDRVRRLPDGNLEFLGRIDDQLKIRGHRIEPGEIEAILSNHPSIRSAAVVARRSTDGDKELVGVIVATPESRLTAVALRDYLRRQLPEPLIPTRWESAPVLPLNANGKVDRPALAHHGGAPLPDALEMVAPRTDLERRWANLWEGVLGRIGVGVLDDFFSIGGHSLAALRLAAAGRREFGIELPVSVIFEHRTVEALARWTASGAAQEPSATAPIAIQPRSVGPTSSLEEQVLFLHETSGDPATYHVPFAYRLEGDLDTRRLTHAWNAVLRRHGILRTRFLRDADSIRQEILDLQSVELAVVDLSPEAEPATSEELRHRLTEFARRPFDLATPPLGRAALFRRGPRDHVLALVFHHALIDEWALREIFVDLARFYRDRDLPSSDSGHSTPSYLDYSIWQRARLTHRQAEEDRAYWRRELASLPGDLRLPYDHPRPVIDPSTGGRITRVTLPELRARFEMLAQALGCSPFVLGLSAFQVFLSRLSGQDDIVVLTPVSLRDRSELQGVAGFFTNIVPVRSRLNGLSTFRDVVAVVQRQVSQAIAHAELPITEISQVVRESQSISDARLSRTIFVLLNEPWPSVELPGLTTTPIEIHTGTAKSDLLLSMTVSPDGGWQMELEYATSVFLPETATRLAGWWEQLLSELVESPKAGISDLRLVNAEEEAQLLRWGAGYERSVPEVWVPSLIKAQAARTPEATAIMGEGGELTFADLDEQSDRLARKLRRLGVGPDVLVGLCLHRSQQLILAIAGILKAGGAYLPLDPDQPAERSLFMLRDSRASLIVTNHRARPLMQGAGLPVVDIEPEIEPGTEPDPAEHPSKQGTASEDLPPPHLHGDHLAYVIYTSGSTGQPKGVMIPHRALANYLAWMREEFPFHPGEVILQSTTFTFDISVWEILLPLISGARMVLVPPEVARDPAQLATLIQRHGVSFAQFVPSLLGALVREPVLRECPALRRIFCGGEALTLDLMKQVLETTHAELFNLYGPTETTIWATCWRCTLDWTASAPLIGKPLANTRAYVVDAHGGLAPVGVVGELVIGGDQVARGYLHRQELTEKRFLRDRFGSKPGARVYRTGDLARWRPDGNLEFLGRQDDQVKIRGFRVELAEIQAAMLEHPKIDQAAVLARGGTDLVGYVVARHHEFLGLDELRHHLETRLPAYMVPSSFVVLDAFPLTSNGKVDRRTLAAVVGAPLRNATAFEAPRPGLEERIAAIWREVLQCQSVGRQDHFFELGGHSLLAMKVAARVSHATQRQVAVQTLFTSPVFSRFCSAVEQSSPVTAQTEGPKLKALPRRSGPTPTSA